MTIVLAETTISLAQAAQRVPGRDGGHPHPATVYRWVTRWVRVPGAGVVKLEGCRVGSTWYTYSEAIDRFVTALSGPAGTPPLPSPTERRRRAARAAAQLSERGY
jgi:hypothetical protein